MKRFFFSVLRLRLLLFAAAFLLLASYTVPAAENRYEVFRAASVTSPVPGSNLVLIGDSRTVAAFRALPPAEAAKCGWSAKSAQGYNWMVGEGVPQAETLMKRGSSAVICLGVNSIEAPWLASFYARYINRKAAEWAKRGVKTYFVSINPVEDAKKEELGSAKRDAQVVAFNEKVKSGLNASVTYVDTYSAVKPGLVTLDGTHYPDELTLRIHGLITGAVLEDNRTAHTNLILHRNTGASDKEIKTQQLPLSGDTAVESPWTRSGYRLLGWAASSAAEKPDLKAGGTVSASWASEKWPCTELYAVWERLPAKVTVTFHRNRSAKDRVTAVQTLKAGQRFTEKGWSRKGYRLIGWSADPSAKKPGCSVRAKAKAAWIRARLPETDLYAVWQKVDSVKVTFYRNLTPGDRVKMTQTFTEGGLKKIRKTKWKREGYRLAGWSHYRSSRNPGYPVYARLSDVFIRKYGPTKRLYAVWKRG